MLDGYTYSSVLPMRSGYTPALLALPTDVHTLLALSILV